MEAPECPVCLQAYGEAGTVPRVLACGHSACEDCLAVLPAPPALPGAVRCPACTQVVPLPRPPGPSALPKNIDLLRLVLSSTTANPSPKPKPQPPPPLEFLPLPWTEPFYSAWKDWVLPEGSLSLVNPSTATVFSSLGRPWCLTEGQRVSLVLICNASTESKCFRLSYVAGVMSSLWHLSERVRGELGSLLEASIRQRRGICRAYGLFLDRDGDKSSLYLVAERFDRDLFSLLDEEKDGVGLGSDGDMVGFGIVGMELCEALMALHSEGIVCGCLWPSSFHFDKFGHCVLDLSNVLVMSRKIHEHVGAHSSHRRVEDPNIDMIRVFVSPEVFLSVCSASSVENSVGNGSDVWSLACILVMLLGGDALLVVQLYEDFCKQSLTGNYKNYDKVIYSQYEVWMEKVVVKLEALLLGTRFEPLLQILTSCLGYNSQKRPQVTDLWHCIRALFVKSHRDDDILRAKVKPFCCCLVLSELGLQHKESCNAKLNKESNISDEVSEESLVESNGSNKLHHEKANGDLVKGLLGGGLKSATLQGHHDCITGLAVGGGFLFSSSFDKTVHVWSLQDFSHVQTLRGPEHRITSMLFVDTNQPLCISGDGGSGIFVWSVSTPIGQEPIKKWYEHNDWRFSGIQSLAVSESGYLYSGSGDKSIKAWSLQDYSLSCTMTGHKSTVSSLTVNDGVLYSGSWDGTIRLWWLHDHSPLAVLENDPPDMLSPILSLTTDHHLIVASCEDGSLKMWRNDTPVKLMQIQQGAIFALHMGAKWLFAGGWDKIINIQELLEDELQVDTRPVASIQCDSVITSLLYWDAKLFVGFSNKEIKVYYYGS